MDKSIIYILFGALCLVELTYSCSSQSNSGWGWTDNDDVIVVQKPTLIPKIKAAFEEGRNIIKIKNNLRGMQKNKGWVQSSVVKNGLGHEYSYHVSTPWTNDFKQVYTKFHRSGAAKDGISFRKFKYDTTNLGWGPGFNDVHEFYGFKK